MSWRVLLVPKPTAAISGISSQSQTKVTDKQKKDFKTKKTLTQEGLSSDNVVTTKRTGKPIKKLDL